MPPEPTARQVGERFSMQHDDGLREVVWTHVRRNWDAWCLTDGVEAKKRSVRSLSAGGASGTGKTRFGSELPQLLWRAAELDAHTPPQLCTALDACHTRKYVLKFAFSRSRDPPSLPDSFTYAADLLWAAYMDAFFGGERIATPGVSTADVYDAISRIERNAVPNALPSVIAVVVHLDEVQNCQMTPEQLGHLVSSLLSPFDAATPLTRHHTLDLPLWCQQAAVYGHAFDGKPRFTVTASAHWRTLRSNPARFVQAHC